MTLEDPAPQVHGGAVTPAAIAAAEPTSEPSAVRPAAVNGLKEAGRDRYGTWLMARKFEVMSLASVAR